MASLPDSRLNSEEKRKEEEETEDEESFLRAMQLVSSVVLPMAVQSATELGVFEVLKEAGEIAKLSAKEIASKISCSNPQAASMLDRLLALLSSHSILHSSLISDHRVPPTFHRLYTITPVAAFFVPNSDGVSLGPVMALSQDKIFLQSCNEHCVKLLKNCYDAIPDDGKVIVVDAVLPKIPETSNAYREVSQMDVLMMTQHQGGKERCEEEFMIIASAAGFSRIRYECHVKKLWVMEFLK